MRKSPIFRCKSNNLKKRGTAYYSNSSNCWDNANVAASNISNYRLNWLKSQRHWP
ncbi:hypothetical protein D3C87_2059650 [compost metagenome]